MSGRHATSPLLPAPQRPASGRPGADAPVRVESPTSLYLAAVRQRDELRKQVSALEETRSGIAQELSEPGLSAVNKTGLEVRLAQTDKQLQSAQDALAVANARVAQAAAVPGTNTNVGVASPRGGNDMPKNVAIVSIMGLAMMTAIMVPLSLAWARRLTGKTSPPPRPQGISPELDERLRRLEQAIESVAIEVERVGESQRFVTQLLAEAPAGALPRGQGEAQPLEARARDVAR